MHESCDALREFDLRSRGCADLVERWKADHDEVRAIWNLEDLIATFLGCHELVDFAFKHYCDHGQFPNPALRFSFFSASLKRFLAAANVLNALVEAAETDGYAVRGSDRFRQQTRRAESIIAEDEFATRASFSWGGLDDWD